MSISLATDADEWVSGCEAKRILGWNWYRLHREALVGKIRALVLLDGRLRFSRTDVERIARHQRTARHQAVEKPAENESDVTSTNEEASRGGTREALEVTPCSLHGAGGGAQPSLFTKDDQHGSV